MTVATVKVVATRFLTNSEPEVLVLKGAWGVGKTYAWNKLVEQHKKEIKLESYCYVSLFGLSSITELRTAIFAKTKSVKLLGEELDAKSINHEWATLASEKLRSWSHSLSRFKDVPYMKNISVGLEALAPHLIRNTIICLDDFERLNQERIKPEEILGFISELKVEKNCKVVLIFNEDELKSKDSYKKYREKVVDIELQFSPTAEEAAELGLPEDMPCREMVKKYAVSLGITNIRILRKIVNLTEMIYKEVATLHTKVMEQAVMTLVLVVWCYYDSSENKPNLEFIIEWNQMVWGMQDNKDKEANPKHEIWAKILQNYGFLHIDEFDRAIYKVTEQGYLEETGFFEEAEKLDAQFRASDLEQSFSSAWNLFHNTFADNQAELTQVLAENLKRSVSYVSPNNLSGTTMLLRQLDKGDVADELIDFYLGRRAHEVELFNLAKYPFPEFVKDPVILEKFKKQYIETHPKTSIIEAVQFMSKNNGWNVEHTEALKNATVDDLYNLFKQEHGDELSRIVKSCLQFEQWNDDKTIIGQNARAALVRIGKENKLNAIRVKRYGITIDDFDGNP